MYKSAEFPDGKGYPRNGNPKFYQLLEEMADTHHRKSHDYASDTNPSGNYHFAGEVANLFSHSPQDAGFVGRIAEKLYRIANLEGSGKQVLNESVEDTERDIAVITLLWITDRRERRNAPNKLNEQLFDLIKLMPDSQTSELLNYIYELRKTRAMGRESNLREEHLAYDKVSQPEQATEHKTPGIPLEYTIRGGGGVTGFGPYPTTPLDSTPDVEVYQLLKGISQMINNFLKKAR